MLVLWEPELQIAIVSMLDMVVYALAMIFGRQRQADTSNFQATLVYIATFRPARDTQPHPASKKQWGMVGERLALETKVLKKK